MSGRLTIILISLLSGDRIRVDATTVPRPRDVGEPRRPSRCGSMFRDVPRLELMAASPGAQVLINGIRTSPSSVMRVDPAQKHMADSRFRPRKASLVR